MIDLSEILSRIADWFGVLKDIKEIAAAVVVAIGWIFRKGFPSAVHIHPIDTTQKHDDMWNWNNRMFRARHPQRYRDFDIVGLELGRDWWRRYPEQDWVVRDWMGEQVGQYSLCPLKEHAFRQLLAGEKLESELDADDLEPTTDIRSHVYWYLANFMVAKRRPGIPEKMSELVRDLMIEHGLTRAMKYKHFATTDDHEIVLVTVLEAPSIHSFAVSNGLSPAHPASRKAHLSKIYYRRYDKTQLKSLCRNATRSMQKKKLFSVYCRWRYGRFFLQPPALSRTKEGQILNRASH